MWTGAGWEHQTPRGRIVTICDSRGRARMVTIVTMRDPGKQGRPKWVQILQAPVACPGPTHVRSLRRDRQERGLQNRVSNGVAYRARGSIEPPGAGCQCGKGRRLGWPTSAGPPSQGSGLDGPRHSVRGHQRRDERTESAMVMDPNSTVMVRLDSRTPAAQNEAELSPGGEG